MSERILIKDLKEHTGKEVSISGWVDVRRDHGKLIFIDLRDRSGKIQMVALPNHDEAHDVADTVRPEWVIEVKGKVNERPEKMINPDLPTGDIEIEITEIIVLNAAAELPFDKDEKLNLDTYLDHLPLTLRADRSKAIFKVQAVIISAFRKFLRQQSFTEFQTPKLVGGDAEGGAGVFKVEYFNKHDAYLATSPQLYKQIMVGIYERVFTTSTVFRAERHSTSRHVNEYTSLDLEMGFINDHHDVMELTGNLIEHIVDRVEKECANELALFDTDEIKMVNPIPHMKLGEAQKILKEKYGEDCVGEPDLEPQHERSICEHVKKEFNSDFVFITHYPVSKRPFYTYEDESDQGYTKSFDLLFRGIEINTGGQRVHDYDTLVAKIQERNLDPNKFSFYLETFKYGVPPHGGFGMGLERLTSKMLGLDNVKEATLFPRDMNRIDTLLSDRDA